MKAKDLLDMEALNLIDIKFQCEFSSQTKIPYRLILKAKHSWSNWYYQTVSVPLDKEVFIYLKQNWPSTTKELMTILLLAGGHKVWQEIENKIMLDYRKRYGIHEAINVKS